jgi:TRAP transporter 4TM/12TM fusion protein
VTDSDSGARGDFASATPESLPSELQPRRVWGATAFLLAGSGLVAAALAINQLMNLQLFAGVVFIENRYLFLLAAALFPAVFLAVPAGTRWRKSVVPWFDWLLATLSLALLLWFAWTAERSLSEGWEYSAPPLAKFFAGILWVLVLEALRRTSGLTMMAIVGLISLYPVVAEAIPNPLKGSSQTFTDTLAFHFASSESAFGIPMRAFAEIVVGFIIFGIALGHTGGGKFFIDLAFAMVGRVRGGAAQVGVISSALQGSISGSVISNVVASGVVTIPAMKRTGFRADYAGAVETVASTGAVLMPPVMGSTAFVMASFLGRSYGEIALAATVPALLFYVALATQIDAYSARLGLRGLTIEELPRVGAVMREGWFYLPVFLLLIVLMVQLNDEALAPFYATGLLIAINQVLPQHRLSWRGLLSLAVEIARGLAELAAILMAVGFIIGALSVTGLAGTLTNDLVYLAGGAPLMLLIMGAITSFVFGMGMTVTACYIFLAIVLAPPLIKIGLDPLAVHLFIMYWGMVSFITPPVALAAFAAAPLAGVSAARIGFQSVRMGASLYLVPFCFVLNPALILRGDPGTIIFSVAAAAAGLIIFAAALQGYVVGVGRVPAHIGGWIARVALLAAGILLAVPAPQFTGIPIPVSLGLGVGLTACGSLLLFVFNARTRQRRKPA